MTKLTPAPLPAVPTWGRTLDPSTKALPSQARGHNRSLVLQTLAVHGTLSRADLARKTGLTRVTVSDLVAELLDSALVIERGQRPGSRPGKPATLLEIDKDAQHIVGVDLSDLTTFRSCLVDLEGTVLAEHELATDGATGREAARLAVEVAAVAVRSATVPLLGIGVGTPGIVDSRGTVLTAPNLGWSDLPLQRLIADELHATVHVANDANAAVMAERRLGEGSADLMLIRIGGGVGAGVLVNGVPRLGAHSAAGEIGHVVVGTDGGPPCACGRSGCLEAWLAVPNLRRLLDSDGTRALVEAGRRLGIALAPVVATLDVSEIALSGPRDLLDGPFLEAAVHTLRQRMLAASHEHLRIRLASLSDDIVLRGAAAIVLAAELGVT
ncbi:ROK family transcriptional regulator [Georgenia satyanarayanai]|uniref:ROK family transcriptional regulator n=1 Tax=Georgenia satyanarayanai TaxID=860221 RepID=UPI001D014D03|nr:ROK family transcriptional regulator [Georgenia satyanarayanai]